MTTLPASASITGVSGGAVLAARYDELEHLAAACARAGLDLVERIALPTSTLVDADLLATAVLAPLSFAHVERMLGATLVDHDGLPAAAAGWEAMAAHVLAARLAIEEVDRGEVQRLWTDATQVLLIASPDADLPDRVTSAMAGLGGLVTAGLGSGGIWLGSRWASTCYGPEGPETTRAVGPTRAPGRASGDVADLAAHLEVLSEAADGTVEVQTLVGPDGTVRHVVFLPGTDDMNPLSNDAQVRDMKENIRLMGGQSTAYGEGILTAMRQAGVRPGEPVLLVGHSQGGMEAVALASHGTPYDVTNVVTFGSPTGQVRHYPHGVQVLSLEHVGDLVPELDGTPSSPDPAQVTVRFDDGIEGLVANHSYAHYIDGAEAVDGSRDPTIRSSLTSLHPFLASGQHATSHAFQITRERR